MTFAVRAETKEGNVLTLRRGFASHDDAEDHRIQLCQWRRVWVEEEQGASRFAAPAVTADDIAALGLPDRITGPLVEYAARERTTVRAVLAEAVMAYLGFAS